MSISNQKNPLSKLGIDGNSRNLIKGYLPKNDNKFIFNGEILKEFSLEVMNEIRIWLPPPLVTIGL